MSSLQQFSENVRRKHVTAPSSANELASTMLRKHITATISTNQLASKMLRKRELENLTESISTNELARFTHALKTPNRTNFHRRPQLRAVPGAFYASTEFTNGLLPKFVVRCSFVVVLLD